MGYPSDCMEEYIEELSDTQLDDLESIVVDCFESKAIHEEWVNALNSEQDRRQDL